MDKIKSITEDRAICPKCDNDEFHVLIISEDEFVQFECLECGFINKPDSPDERSKKFITLMHCKTS